MPAASPFADISSPPKTGPRSALKVKLMKLTTPVAVPLTVGGLASLITVYGSMAAPAAPPPIRARAYGGNTPAGPSKNQAGHGNSTAAPPTITGLGRPMRSDRNPSSGQPMIQPNGT